jgi:uncharacterized SAM-dependent methyltransferase
MDLAATENWVGALASNLDDRDPRVILFYGMLPNMDPAIVGPRLAALLRPGDLLLLSANLASGTDYTAGAQAVLPLYENSETRAWLALALEDLGLSPMDSEWRFEIAASKALEGLLGIEVSLVFETAKRVAVGDEVIELPAGEPLRILRSNRYTVEMVQAFLAIHGIEILDRAISGNGQEGVFLARKR